MRLTLTYSARILTLILSTVLGVLFGVWCVMVAPFFFKMPGIVSREDLVGGIVVGVGFAFFAAMYVVLVRKTPKRSPN
jgi:hypothetical protein